jgi:hypothetical protein
MQLIIAFAIGIVVSYIITSKLFETDSAMALAFNFALAFAITYVLA